MSSLIKLIEAVKSHPKLFKYSNDEDLDNLNEWLIVADKCKLTRLEAQDQWNLLLLQYVDYLRSNQDFPLAKYMDFLQPHFFRVIDNENIDEDELLNALDSEISTPKVNHQKDIEKSSDVNKKIKVEHCIKSNISEEPPIPIKTVQQPQSLQVNLADNIGSQNNPSFTNLSSLELIFLGYAKQLQKMSLPQQLKTKRKIADIMDEAELEMMNIM